MNRKAQSSQFRLIIGAIVILLLIFLSIRIFVKVESATDEKIIDEECTKALLMNRATLRINPDRKFLDSDIAGACPTKYVTFFSNRKEIDYEHFTSEDHIEPEPYHDEAFQEIDCSTLSGDETIACILDNVNQEIAEEMVICWNKFGIGEKAVIFNNQVAETKCLVCTVVFFDATLQDKYGGSYLGVEYPENSLDEYMRNHNVLVSQSGGAEVTYYEYTLDFIDKQVTLPYYDYDMDEEYAIVLISNNEKKLVSIIDNLFERFGWSETDDDENFANTLEFIENSRVPEICEEIV